MTTEIKIIRGVSGSGKSTYIEKHFPGAVVCSADHFFIRNGAYVFNPSLLRVAHQTCFDKFQDAVRAEKPLIVVDNTNTQLWAFQRYLDFAAQWRNCRTEVIRLVCDPGVAAARNVHDVPSLAIDRMQKKFEDYPGEKIVFTSGPSNYLV